LNGEFLWGYLRETDHLKDPSLDGRMILKFIKEWAGPWTGLIWLRTGTGGGFCEYGNAHPTSIRCREFLDYLRIC
jgi:hypothetical protein